MKTKAFLTFIASITLTGCYGNRPTDLTVETVCPTSPNCVSSLTNQADKKIEPFLLKKSPQSWIDLLSLIEKQPRITIISSNSTILHAEFRTKWLKFIDDVVMRRTGNQVDIRSASRIGHSDFGANRKRVESLREQLKLENIIVSP